MSDTEPRGSICAHFDSDDIYVYSYGNKTQSLGRKYLQLSTSALCGVIFGFAFEKGRVFEPEVIVDQLTFTRNIVLRMLLATSATSMFSFSILYMLPSSHKHLIHATRNLVSDFANKGICTSIVGGGILGIGMSLCGSSPGIAVIQIGAGMKDAVFTFLGGLCGTVLYGLMSPLILKATKPKFPTENHFVHQHLNSPYFTLALPCMALLGMKLFALELSIPWASEVSTGGEGILHCLSWPPYITGILVALLQVPLVIINNQTLGFSDAYCTIMSQVFRPSWLDRLCPYLAKHRSGIDKCSRVLLLGGALVGGYLSSSLSDSSADSTRISPVTGFLGGMCMLFGSRLSGGCASAHGISGVGLISVLSATTLCAVFGGGMLTTFCMRKFLPQP